MNGFKDSLFVGAVPAEPSVADDMVGRYETEMAGIYRLVGIIGQYPIVVLSEKEEISLPPVPDITFRRGRKPCHPSPAG